MFEWIVVRTRHLDAVIQEAVKGGARQVVMLGAGYDSRGLRFGPLLVEHGVTLFEFDHPATQQRKLLLLGESPAHVRYVPADFNNSSLEELLAGAGISRDLNTLVIWEGVAPYLDSSAVDLTIRGISAYFQGACALVVDLAQRYLAGAPADRKVMS